MIRSQIVVLWQNDDDNSMTVSHRFARFYTEPNVLADPPRVASVVDVGSLADSVSALLPCLQ